MTGTDAGIRSHGWVASIVVPAHDEERVIGRLLDALVPPGADRDLEVIVVCNGCTDATAAVAAAHDAVHVIELTEPSKREALRVGDTAATAFPRLYVDADVVLTAEAAHRLADAVRGDAHLAGAPERTLRRDGVASIVRWYYDVWERLPQVRGGLFGRGVIALSEPGNQRIRALPPMMGDDLVASESFAAHERIIVTGAHVQIFLPKRVRDLHRRRVRAITGNVQADREGLRRNESVTSVSTLARLVRDEPRLAGKVTVFVGVTVASRLAARRVTRRGDFDTWLRDESSRDGV